MTDGHSIVFRCVVKKPDTSKTMITFGICSNDEKRVNVPKTIKKPPTIKENVI